MFRKLLAQKCLMMPGAYNGMVGRQCADNGFEALYISGAAVTASSGVPDIGYIIDISFKDGNFGWIL